MSRVFQDTRPIFVWTESGYLDAYGERAVEMERYNNLWEAAEDIVWAEHTEPDFHLLGVEGPDGPFDRETMAPYIATAEKRYAEAQAVKAENPEARKYPYRIFVKTGDLRRGHDHEWLEVKFAATEDEAARQASSISRWLGVDRVDVRYLP